MQEARKCWGCGRDAILREGCGKDFFMLTRTDIETKMLPAAGSPAVRWRISDGLVPYEQAVEEMEREVSAIASGRRMNSSGFWSIRRFIRPAPAPMWPI